MGVGFAVGDAGGDFVRAFLPFGDFRFGERAGAAVQQGVGIIAWLVGDALGVQLLFVDDTHLGQVERLLPLLARGQDAEFGVVVFRVVGGEGGFQPFLDGQPRRKQQEAADEAPVAGVGLVVGGLPDDQHGHGEGFAGAGGHLVGDARDAVVPLGVYIVQFLGDVIRRDFFQVDVRQYGVELGEIEAVIRFVFAGACHPVAD